eukprot:CAMPEP_0119561888 /NCGR_PEP_ID=MMETSP1352-20130426/18949_1 /TAXON_ID=265584 /ORGANISM="Stauroneis constricta, Strain CCMP1120" /LENGTH=218 /DNA_ID=CAMNT_0007610197 /DNA_START=35 /DNA_END=691 /DNA_ORIENTATION=+
MAATLVATAEEEEGAMVPNNIEYNEDETNTVITVWISKDRKKFDVTATPFPAEYLGEYMTHDDWKSLCLEGKERTKPRTIFGVIAVSFYCSLFVMMPAGLFVFLEFLPQFYNEFCGMIFGGTVVLPIVWYMLRRRLQQRFQMACQPYYPQLRISLQYRLPLTKGLTETNQRDVWITIVVVRDKEDKDQQYHDDIEMATTKTTTMSVASFDDDEDFTLT